MTRLVCQMDGEYGNDMSWALWAVIELAEGVNPTVLAGVDFDYTTHAVTGLESPAEMLELLLAKVRTLPGVVSAEPAEFSFLRDN